MHVGHLIIFITAITPIVAIHNLLSCPYLFVTWRSVLRQTGSAHANKSSAKYFDVLILYGHQVWEALDVSEVLFLSANSVVSTW
jgi:hypothetical protein